MKKALLVCVVVLVAAGPSFAAGPKAISKLPAPTKLVPATNPVPMGGPCLAFDDGVIGNGWAWYEAGSYWGMHMTASSYPYQITDIDYMNYVGWPSSTIYPCKVSIWDCDNNLLVEEDDMPTGQGTWNVHMLATPLTVNSDFIVAVQQTTPYPTCNGQGVDDQAQGWYMRDQTFYYASPPWAPGCYNGGAGYGNFMIRTNCKPGGVSCKLTLYQLKVPKGATLDFCKTWTNFDDVSHTITGRLYFYDASHTLRRSVAYPSFTLGAGQTMHKIFAFMVPGNTPLGSYTVENVGTYDGGDFSCVSDPFTVIDAADGYVAGMCP
jgi:hypothetical protein